MDVRQRPVSTLLSGSLLALLSTSALGCGLSSGSDYGVTVTWLINGTAPSRALCRANGVDRIRFTVRKPGKKLSLEAACESAIGLADEEGNVLPYGGFTTTASFNYETNYRYEVAMLDSAGKVLSGLSYEDSFQVYYNDEQPWPLRPLELFAPLGDTAVVDAAWTVGAQEASEALCSQLGASDVAVDVASSTDFDFVDPVEVARGVCSDGRIVTDQAVLAEGEYWVRYVSLDAEGNELDAVAAEQLYIIDAPGEIEIEEVDFKLP